MSGIYLDVNGQPAPIEECSWLLVAPCTCVAGITVAGRRGDSAPIISAEQAMRDFTPNAEARRRDVTAGWSTRLAGNGRAAVNELVGPTGCPHTPKWGVEPTPVLDGFAWAACRASKRQHLAPVASLASYETTTVLCGYRSYGWNTEEWRLMDLATCLRCDRDARKRNAGVTS